jgi:hypothetical protein
MRLSGKRRWKEDQRKVTRRMWLGPLGARLPFHSGSACTTIPMNRILNYQPSNPMHGRMDMAFVFANELCCNYDGRLLCIGGPV